MHRATEIYKRSETFLPNPIFLHKYTGWVIFVLVYGLYSVLLFIANTYIFTDQIYYRSFSDQLTLQSIEAFLDIRDQYWWLNYVLKPLILLLKVSFAAVCISIGAVLSTIEFKFKTIFKAVLLAEGVFILAQVLYLVNLSFHLDSLTFESAANYYPLTVLGFFGAENVVPWLRYPFQTLNVFELLYMTAIAWLLSRQWEEDFIESLALVAPSYGTGLILWLVLVTFLTLQVS